MKELEFNVVSGLDPAPEQTEPTSPPAPVEQPPPPEADQPKGPKAEPPSEFQLSLFPAKNLQRK